MTSRVFVLTKKIAGLLLSVSMAFLLPILAPLLGAHSNVPASWGALAYPFVLIPFLMGFAQPLFLLPWRLQLGAPAIVIAAIAVVAILNSVRTHQFLNENLFFYGTLLIGYVIFSRLGLMTATRLRQKEKRDTLIERPVS